MSKQTEALKLALEALENLYNDTELLVSRWQHTLIRSSITAIREALAEQTVRHTEPCGWRMKHNGEWVYSFTEDAWDFIRIAQPAQPAQQEPVGEVFGYYERGFTEQKTLYGKLHNQDLPVGAKLYTSPPARKPWVGLTDEEISGVLGGDIYDENSGLLTFTRAIEAKLKEKNT